MVRVVDGQLGYPAAAYQAQDRSAAVEEAAALDTGLSVDAASAHTAGVPTAVSCRSREQKTHAAPR